MFLSLEPEAIVASYPLCPFGYQAGAGAGLMPTHLGRDVSPPLSCIRSWLWSLCSPHAGRAWSQRELHCVSYPHALFPPAHSLPYPLSAPRSSGGCTPASHNAWHIASDPSWPPHPGSLEGRDCGPHPELAVTHSLSRGVGMSKLEGPWELSQPSPLVCRQETSPQGLRSLPGLAVPWADPGLELGAPEAHRTLPSSCLRQP